MQTSIKKISYTKKYNFLSPDFFLDTTQSSISRLEQDSKYKIIDLFTPLTATVSKGHCQAVCYDLTHSLSNFLDVVKPIEYIASNKKKFSPNNLIISRLRPYLKEIAIIPTLPIDQIGSTEYLVYESKDSNKFSTHSLLAFLLTKDIQLILLNSLYGTEHPRFYDFILEGLYIPNSVLKLNSELTTMVLKAHAERENADTLTKEAQTLLEKELGIYEWTPTKQKLNTSIKKHSDTTQANRIDAEYYQPKYDAILEKITSYKGGYKAIHELCTLNKDTFKITKDTEYQYVEIGSISVGNGDITSSPLLGADLPANCKRVLYKDDLLVSKVRPYRGAIAIVDKNDYVGSGAFTVLQANKEINKETLYTFLRLPIMLELSLKPSTGTSYPVIIDEDVANTIIPILDKKIQDEIAIKITNAHQSRQESKRLLELAKSTVEHAIEHGETKK